MKKIAIDFELPQPWQGKRFRTSQFGYINYLVGANGTGKSRFVDILKGFLPHSRLLGTDRLRGLEKAGGMGMYGEFNGIDRTHFQHYKLIGTQSGFGLDAFVLLEERFDLRIRVEATLSQLFDRTVVLEWDSGRLVPSAILGTAGPKYRIAAEECHGLKELLVLLTHLYCDDYHHLIIDEPELHLHPQLQAFLMDEVRKVAGDPDAGGKCVYLVTHSPFILDFRSAEDVQCVISFNRKYGEPRHMLDADGSTVADLAALSLRLNAHHKQLFFSDNPVFVEGPFDSEIVNAIQHARGESPVAAGSCVIDAGGKGEVSKYVRLCDKLGKNAHFIYDLDSLFRGTLRRSLADDKTVTDFLLDLGIGSSFANYCGQLDQSLTTAIKSIDVATDLTGSAHDLQQYIHGQKSQGKFEREGLQNARIAFLVGVRRDRQALVDACSGTVIKEIEGRLKQVGSALASKNVHLLMGGALEHYLPSFAGDVYRLSGDAKAQSISAELAYLTCRRSDVELKDRYGDLYEAVRLLPSKGQVQVDQVLEQYLRKYVLDVQVLVRERLDIRKPEELTAALQTRHPASARVFNIIALDRRGGGFAATVRITKVFATGDQLLHVSDTTNAGMESLRLVPAS